MRTLTQSLYAALREAAIKTGVTGSLIGGSGLVSSLTRPGQLADQGCVSFLTKALSAALTGLGQ